MLTGHPTRANGSEIGNEEEGSKRGQTTPDTKECSKMDSKMVKGNSVGPMARNTRVISIITS